ncbi:hypothetical protein EZS27_003600 [termite gut metagenome]|uniref:Uncharacterized protein n=1 Tax=termite gut metagenome TaxID=433724 RepID=A0A5J4SUX5_9ZZZZ
MVTQSISLSIWQKKVDTKITQDNILNWLQTGANTAEGIRLAEQSGAPSLTLRLFHSNPTANRRVMMEWLCRTHGIEANFQTLPNHTEVVIRRSTSFREEFPFLNQPDCPTELETLASRKFAKYHAYVDLHRKLQDCTTLQECADTSRQLIDNYLENREIWEELNYYKAHHTLLGKHSIFREFARRKELLAMPVKELMLRKSKVESNIWRVKNEIKKGNKPHLDAERKERLTAYETELAEVNRLLG